MPMDSPASDYPVVNLPLTSSVYFKNGNPVRTSGAPLEGLVRVTEGENGKFIGMGEIDDEGRVAPRRPWLNTRRNVNRLAITGRYE